MQIIEGLAKEYPQDPLYRKHLGWSNYGLGIRLSRAGRLQEAEAALKQSAALYESALAHAPQTPDHARELTIVLCELGGLLQAVNRPDEAEETFRRSVAMFERSVK